MCRANRLLLISCTFLICWSDSERDLALSETSGLSLFYSVSPEQSHLNLRTCVYSRYAALRGSAQGVCSRKRLKHPVSLKSRSRPRAGQQARQIDEISRSRFARHMTRPRLAQNDLTKSSRVRLISGLSWPSGCDICESTMSAKISTCFAGLNPPPTWDPGCVSGDRNERLTQA